jgi:TonB-dependent starch-binding outer membrane protein SusC
MYVSVHQTLRVMRIMAILLTVCSMAVSAGTLSQNAKITFSGKNVKLESVFKAVQKQTGYYLICQESLAANAKPITVQVKNMALSDFMDLILKGQDLEWVLENTTILIQKVKQESPNVEATSTVASIDVSGKITNSHGNPIPDANVVIKGTKRGTTTDNEGNFRIAADQGSVLEISAIGFGKREIKINGSQQIVVVLEIASSVLDEVQYIAYGQTSKRYSTSNIGSVKAADIEKQPVQNPLLTLQGRVPGLFITQPSGIAGTSVKVRIQGQNSIANGNEPLYVIDGVPIDAVLPRTGVDGVLGPLAGSVGAGSFAGYGSPLNYLNPLDIESVDVLKDADATAIYGSRAANGAILITTKKGKAGLMKLDVNMQTGWGKMNRRMEMMNTRQYLDMRYEAFANENLDWRSPSVSANDLKVWDTTSYTNWQDVLIGGTAHYSDIYAAVSGGSPNLSYLVSGTYHKETTVFPFPDFTDQRATVHFSLNASSNNKKIRMQFTGNYMFDVNRLPQADLTRAALLREPNAPPLLNADGSINWAPDANGNSTTGGNNEGNAMIQRFQKYQNNTFNLVSRLKLDYTVLPGLDIGTSIGYNQMQTTDYWPYPMITIAPEARTTSRRFANFGNRNAQAWIVEPQASYRKKISEGTFDMVVGSSFQSSIAEANSLVGLGQLSDDLLDNINSAATIEKGTGYFSQYRYNAVFARTNFNWRDRYIVNINARRDGSSRFGADNRFSNFGSVGAAWIFSNENFLKLNTSSISFGKLRGSYGTTGSDQIGDYQFMSLYRVSTTSVPYQGIVGLYPGGLPNPQFQWERTRKLQVGIDLGFFQDRILINATFVRNRCSNQLLNYTLPIQTGYGGYVVNFPATIQNKNWELSITGKFIESKNVSWTSSLNVTLPQNRLIAFPDIANSSYAEKLRIGAPMDISRSYHWLGVAPGTGDYLFADKKGNPTITPNEAEDRNVLISSFPKLYGGFQNTISYKGIQLDFLFQFTKQTGYYFGAAFNGFIGRSPGMFAAGRSNVPITLIDRWQKPGDTNKLVARYSTTGSLGVIVESDRMYSDASYLRLKNISLSWYVPEKWLVKVHCRSLQLYLHGQNLLTFTNYKGLDPEVQGLSLPPLQLYTIGIKLGI